MNQTSNQIRILNQTANKKHSQNRNTEVVKSNQVISKMPIPSNPPESSNQRSLLSTIMVVHAKFHDVKVRNTREGWKQLWRK